MWLKFFVLALCAAYSTLAQSVQIEPFQSVFSKAEGSSLQVNCTSPNSVEWISDPPGAMPDNGVKARTSNGDNINTLMLVNITKSMEGTFFCKETQNQNQVSFQLRVFSVTTRNATFEYKVDATLECSVNVETSMPFTYSWKKGDLDVDEIEVEGKQGYKSHSNGTLEIIHPARSFAGMYTCIAQYELLGTPYNISVDVPYYATPKVLPFDKSKNLVQDEKLVVECQVLGYPKPYIIWQKGDEVIQSGKDSRIKLYPADTYDGKPIDNARLEIGSVDFDDAGEYKCLARHDQWSNFTSSQPILVRVKDKLAALWPFLGIVAEVVILCIIIFVYEKKRNKDAVLDEDGDQNRTTPEKQSDNVRHRGNTNNPRA